MGVVIMTSAGERASFKMMIDAMKPFRFFLAQLITLIYVPIMFAIVSYIHRIRHYVVWVRSISDPARWYYYNDLNKNRSPSYSFLEMVTKSREGGMKLQ